MKLLFNLTKLASACAILALATGCESTNSAATATSQKEMALTQAGFKLKTVTTAKQKELLAKLPADTVSTVKYNGTTYYVYPTGKTNQVLVGKRPQFNAAKNMVVAKAHAAQPAPAQGQATAQATPNNYGTSQPISINPNPRGVSIQEFDGFGPMDDGSSW